MLKGKDKRRLIVLHAMKRTGFSGCFTLLRLGEPRSGIWPTRPKATGDKTADRMVDRRADLSAGVVDHPRLVEVMRLLRTLRQGQKSVRSFAIRRSGQVLAAIGTGCNNDIHLMSI